MKVYILDVQGKSRGQMLQWLSEDKRVERVEVFEDYIRLIDQVEKSPPDFCIIRVGCNGIPGLKAADMIKQLSSDTNVIFVSDDTDYAINAYEVGAYGYLLYPFNKEKFEKCLGGKKQ